MKQGVNMYTYNLEGGFLKISAEILPEKLLPQSDLWD